MSRRIWKLFATLIIVMVVVVLAVWCSLPGDAKPKLSVSYLATIDGNGHWRLQFGVTNIGNSRIVTSPIGFLEVLGRTNKMHVGATAPLSWLVPGQGQIVEAVLSDANMASIDGPWRFTCLYARDNFRTRINQGEYGPFVSRHIPRPFKGVPLTVMGTSDWTNLSK